MNRPLVAALSSAPQILRGRAISFLKSEALALTVALALVFLVYVPTLNDYFHGDDFLAFVDLTTLKPWQQVSNVFTFNDSNVYWRPLGHLFYLGIYQAAGLDPYYFHLAAVGVFLATLGHAVSVLRRARPRPKVALALSRSADCCQTMSCLSLGHERAAAARRIVRAAEPRHGPAVA